MLKKLKKELGLREKKEGVFHKFILHKMKDKIENDHNNIIKRKDAVYIITRHMSSDCVQQFLNEMEKFNLIKQNNKQNIELLK